MAVRKPSTTPRRQTAAEPSVLEPIALTPEEAWALYDARARELLGISADEFESRLASGDFEGRQEDPGFRRVIMLRTSRPG